MRFLGYGIGHKGQTIASPDEAGYEAPPEESPPNTMRVAHIAQNVQPRLNVSDHVVADDTENGDEDPYAEDSDANGDTDSDEENLYGHF